MGEGPGEAVKYKINVALNNALDMSLASWPKGQRNMFKKEKDKHNCQGQVQNAHP